MNDGAQPRVLVIGGGAVSINGMGEWVTKTPIAEYLVQIADSGSHVVWMASEQELDVEMHGVLDPFRIEVVPLVPGWRRYPTIARRLPAELCARPRVLGFLPAFMWFTPLIPILRLFVRRLVIYLAGDFYAVIEVGGATRSRLWRIVYRWAHESALASADAVIARGKHLVEVARRFNSTVIETVPIARTGKPIERDVSSGGGLRRVLFIGKIAESKGVFQLLEAFQSLLNRGRALTLDYVGDGPALAALRSRVDELNLGNSVNLHGWVDDDERIETFFRESDLLVVPSSSHPEGVPRVIDEAMMRDLPVVATRVGGIPSEFTEDEVFLVDPGVPEELIRGMTALLWQPSEIRRVQRGARIRARRWWDQPSAGAQHARVLFNGLG